MHSSVRTLRLAVLLAAALAALALGVVACAKKSTRAATMPGMTYESLKLLPDFSGWWYRDLPSDQLLPSIARIPLKPKAAALLKDIIAKFKAGNLPDLGASDKNFYCSPPRFLGENGGSSDEMEFLFTPGRVTLLDEGGLVRRIYLSDRSLPGDLDESNSGTSVGHWEGRTLVVETGGLDSQAKYLGPFSLGHNVRVIERMTLKSPDELEIASRMTAPDLFAAPYEEKYVYRRDRGRTFHEALDCVDTDRSVDPNTGRQRFDLTPPKDLPPPPSD